MEPCLPPQGAKTASFSPSDITHRTQGAQGSHQDSYAPFSSDHLANNASNPVGTMKDSVMVGEKGQVDLRSFVAVQDVMTSLASDFRVESCRNPTRSFQTDLKLKRSTPSYKRAESRRHGSE